jgi:hypothetical protein
MPPKDPTMPHLRATALWPGLRACPSHEKLQLLLSVYRLTAQIFQTEPHDPRDAGQAGMAGQRLSCEKSNVESEHLPDKIGRHASLSPSASTTTTRETGTHRRRASSEGSETLFGQARSARSLSDIVVYGKQSSGERAAYDYRVSEGGRSA